MVAVRLIPCLDMDAGRVVKGVRFRNLRDAGDPVVLAAAYSEAGADEIAVLDVGATVQRRAALHGVIERLARQVFVPLAAGGGIRSVADMDAMLAAGADKITMCSAALADPALISDGARQFGTQCMVISVDARRSGRTWRAMVAGGTRDSGRDAVEWAVEAVQRGAGEILLNAVDRDGTGSGYDLALIRAVTTRVTVPVIASGGGATAAHMKAAVDAGASAVLLASRLHDGCTTIPELKRQLKQMGVPIRC